MQIFYTQSSLRNFLNAKHSIGFVPTMGALHEGHLELIKASKKSNKTTVCSIFVNPTQFNNPQDLEKYPRTTEQDIALLESVDCEVLFLPSVEEIYPTPNILTFDFGYQNSVMEGKFRPGHFSGVGVVVSKLFNIVQPHKAYFGQKDFQQCLIIKQLVQELFFPIELIIVDTKREADGLAMSSRNKRLNDEARAIAPKLYQTLQFAILQTAHSDVKEISLKCSQILNAIPLITVEYVEFVDWETGKIVESLQNGRKYGICIAAQVGEVRLIDNIIFVA